MSIEDRLAAQREVLRDQAEEPIRLRKLQAAILEFGVLLIDSDKLSRHTQSVVNDAVHGVAGSIHTRFQEMYEKEYLKAAFMLIGIYEAIFGGQ